MTGVSQPRVIIVSNLPCCISLGWIGRSSVLRSTHLQKRHEQNSKLYSDLQSRMTIYFRLTISTEKSINKTTFLGLNVFLSFILA